MKSCLALVGLVLVLLGACGPAGAADTPSAPSVEPVVSQPSATAYPLTVVSSMATPEPTAPPATAPPTREPPPARPEGDHPGARPGPYRRPDYSDFALESFAGGQRIAGTYYFYWYDWPSRYFLEPPAALPRPPAEPRFRPTYHNHPPDREQVSFCNPAWHRRQIEDMLAAGLDFYLPIYWGRPGRYGRQDGVPVCSLERQPDPNDYWNAPHFAPVRDAWPTEGLPPMIEAMDAISADGRRPPRIGMFLDTTIMDDADLRTPEGKAYLYAVIRDFFSRVPPRYWAAIDGRPLLWFYDAQRVAAFDQTTFDYVYEHFPRDFGGHVPFIVRELQWKNPKVWNDAALAASLPPIQTESLYAWGAAPFGYNADVPDSLVAQVGPGFDTRSWPDVVYADRENGAFFQRHMAAALRSGKSILMVETWNEWTESSGVAETVEFGRQYIDLTRRCLDLFKRNVATRGDRCAE